MPIVISDLLLSTRRCQVFMLQEIAVMSYKELSDPDPPALLQKSSSASVGFDCPPNSQKKHRTCKPNEKYHK